MPALDLGVAISQATPGTTNKVSIGTDGEVMLKAGSAAIGKLGANSGVDIGDTDVTSVDPGVAATNLGKAEDAAHSSGDVGVMALAVRKDAAVATAAANDYVPLLTDAVGQLWTHQGENGKTRIGIQVALSASQTGGTVWDPTAGKKFVLTSIVVSCVTAGLVRFFDNTDTAASLAIGPILNLTAGGGWDHSWPVDMPYRSATADNVLKYTSGTFVGSVYVEGWEE